MITTFLSRITPPCKDVTYLASRTMDRALPWSMRLNLQLHCWVCKACDRYRDQLRTVRQGLLRSTGTEGEALELFSPAPAVHARLTAAFRAKHE